MSITIRLHTFFSIFVFILQLWSILIKIQNYNILIHFKGGDFLAILIGMIVIMIGFLIANNFRKGYKNEESQNKK